MAASTSQETLLHAAASAEKPALPVSQPSRAEQHGYRWCPASAPAAPPPPWLFTSSGGLGCSDPTGRGHHAAPGTPTVELGSLSLCFLSPSSTATSSPCCLQLDPDARKYLGCLAEMKTRA